MTFALGPAMNPMASIIAAMGGTPAPAAAAVQPQQPMVPPGVSSVQTDDVGPAEVNPMRRFLAGLGQAAAGARPGMSPGMAFAQGLGGGIQGGLGYETQQQQLQRQMEQDRRAAEHQAFQQRMGVLAADDRATRTDLARQGQEDQRNYRQESLEVQRQRLRQARGTQQYPHVLARIRSQVGQRAYNEVYGNGGNIQPTWNPPAGTNPAQQQAAREAEYNRRREQYLREAGADEAGAARWAAPEGGGTGTPSYTPNNSGGDEDL